MDCLLGMMPDAEFGRLHGMSEGPPLARRRVLGIPSYRTKLKAAPIPCANCSKIIERRRRDHKRAKKLFCSRECADAGQKRRDSETLRYGPGWKNRRAEIRKQQPVCQACEKTPQANGSALHVHHLKPFRFGGTNQPHNLKALCDSCHHRIEAITEQVLSAIQIDITIETSTLTILVDGNLRWRGSALGADIPTENG